MSLEKLCKRRAIGTSGIKTPLLIPSFSSKGFSEISEIHRIVSEYLTSCKLVSAYDLYYDKICYESLYDSDFVLIDSGGYEVSQNFDISDGYKFTYGNKEWNLNLYRSVVDKLERSSDIAIVNFDRSSINKSIEDQVEEATVFFLNYFDIYTDFLVKPSEGSNYINIDEYIINLDKILCFDILGFTEKELGDSIEIRLRNLMTIRNAITERNHNNPIHIFGCIDPGSAWLYYMLGADIFDGLSWLRYSFIDSGYSVYPSANNIFGNIALNDSEHYVRGIYSNLNLLDKISDEMKAFAENHSFDRLSCHEIFRNRYQEIVSNLTGGV